MDLAREKYKEKQYWERAENKEKKAAIDAKERERQRLEAIEKEFTIVFCKEIACLLGLVPNMSTPIPTTKAGDKIDISKIDLFRNTLKMLWVFADFIEPTMVGPHLSNILRIVPIQAEFGKLEHHMFALQYYIPVKRLHLQQFRIEIREIMNGPTLKIRGKVMISLHFRIKEKV